MTIEMKIKNLVDKYVALTRRYGDSIFSKRIEGEIDRYEIMLEKGYTIVYELDGKECFR